jgi:hypothetical protein
MITRIYTLNSPFGSVRFHLAGTEDQLALAREDFESAGQEARSFQDFLDRAMNVVLLHNLQLADVMQTPSILRPGERLAAAVDQVMHERDAEKAWRRIISLIRQAEEGEVLGLATDGRHRNTRAYMHSVFGMLDEAQESAFEELAEAIGTGVTALLLEN